MEDKRDKKGKQDHETHQKEEKLLSEKRKEPRFNVGIKVGYMVLMDSLSTPYMEGSTQSINLSESGVCILIDERIKVPMLIQLNLRVSKIQYPLILLGKVEWCKEYSYRKYLVGIRFIGNLPTDWAKVVKLASQSTLETKDKV